MTKKLFRLLSVPLGALVLLAGLAYNSAIVRPPSKVNIQRVLISSSGQRLGSLFDGILPNRLYSWKPVEASARKMTCAPPEAATSKFLDKLMGIQTVYAQSCTSTFCTGSWQVKDELCCPTCPNAGCTDTTKFDPLHSDERHGQCRDGNSCANGGIPCGCKGIVCDSGFDVCAPFP